MKKCIKCGSHAFNLYAEWIDQGGFCDVHYWQGRAHRAEAQPAQGCNCNQGQCCHICDPDIANGWEQPAQEPDELTIAYMSGLYDGKKKRPWVGLTDENAQIAALKVPLKDRIAFDAGMSAAAKILKEKNT